MSTRLYLCAGVLVVLEACSVADLTAGATSAGDAGSNFNGNGGDVAVSGAAAVSSAGGGAVSGTNGGAAGAGGCAVSGTNAGGASGADGGAGSDQDAGPSTVVAPATIVAIENVSTQKYLDVQGLYMTDGTPVWSYSYTGAPNQQWIFHNWGGGTYEIVNINSAKCLDVADDLTDNGSTLDQYACTGANNQLWSLQVVNGMLQIVGKSSGKCLLTSGQSDASRVVIWDCIPDLSEGWLLKEI